MTLKGMTLKGILAKCMIFDCLWAEWCNIKVLAHCDVHLKNQEKWGKNKSNILYNDNVLIMLIYSITC